VTVVGGQTRRVRQRSHEGFLTHAGYRWLQIATVLCVAAIGLYWWSSLNLDEPPSGGSWVGYLLGTVSAGLIVWLACLGIRKRAVSDGPYLLKAWVSAHVYLGLSLIVLATLHTGFQFNWNIHLLAYVLMMLVIASGAFGVWAYAVLPQALHGNRGTTTRKQMLETIDSLDAQLHEAALPLDREAAGIVRLSIEKTDLGGGFWRRLLGLYGDCANRRAISRIHALSARGAHPQAEAVARIEGLMRQKADALALARRQMRITALLEAWLFVHIPATFALLAALVAHIVSVFAYW
jgi:hypothetical protein